MEIQTHACDVCEKLKEKSNHWWKIFITDGTLHVTPWHKAEAVWKEIGRGNWIVEGEYDLCGLEHLQQKISELTARTK